MSSSILARAESGAQLFDMSDSVVDVVDDGKCWQVLGVDGSLTPTDKHDSIPWRVPNLIEVRQFKTYDTRQMFEKVRSALAACSELPGPEYFDLLTTWAFHTYIYDRFDYSPQLILYGDQERGKSRTGRATAWVSFRGFATETVNSAYLFRLTRTGYTVFVDVVDVAGKVTSRDSLDLFQARFEKGVTVQRVNRPEQLGLDGIDTYRCYGPTIIATNRPIDGRWQSRGLVITPPQSNRQFVRPPNEEELSVYRAMLVAWRWRVLESGLALPQADGYGTGRFRDITRPLRQVAQMIAPDPARVDRALKDIYDRRQQLRAESPEAVTVMAIETAGGGGFVATADVRAAINDGVSDRWGPSMKEVGDLLSGFGFRRAKRNGRRGILVDPKLLADLKAKYGVTD